MFLRERYVPVLLCSEGFLTVSGDRCQPTGTYRLHIVHCSGISTQMKIYVCTLVKFSKQHMQLCGISFRVGMYCTLQSAL